MIFLSDFENLIISTQQNIADELGLTQSIVARSIKKLLETRWVHKIDKNGKQLYEINETLVWKGKPENRKSKKDKR